MSRRLLCALLLASSGSFAESGTFAVDPTASSLFIHVGKTGIGSFAGGHEHEVVALLPHGEVAADFDDVSRSSFEVVVDAAALTVVAKGEPEGDAAKVEQAMKGPEVLDVQRFPTISFRSRQIAGRPASPGAYDLDVLGDLSLHGQTRPVAVPLRVERHGAGVTAIGKFVVKQTDFGIEPVSAAGGLVKVEDEVRITLRINAQAAAPRPR